MRTISNDLPLIIPLFDPSRSDQSIWTWWNREGSCWFDQVCPDVMRFIVRVRPSQVHADAALWSRRTSNSTSRPRCLLSCVAAKAPPLVLDMSNGLGGREGVSCVWVNHSVARSKTQRCWDHRTSYLVYRSRCARSITYWMWIRFAFQVLHDHFEFVVSVLSIAKWRRVWALRELMVLFLEDIWVPMSSISKTLKTSA